MIFTDIYDTVASSNNFIGIFEKSATKKTCRFCLKSFPEVTFENKPHIIPELFGRNKCISNFECDTCNSKFQNYENDTATLIQHYLTLLNLKSKKGVPIFQSENSFDRRSTTLKTVGTERIFRFGTNKDDFELNKEDGTLRVLLRTKRISLYSIYRIFLKMGICLLKDEDLEDNSHFLHILNLDIPLQNSIQINGLYRTKLLHKYYTSPAMSLYKARRTVFGQVIVPEFCTVLCFANIFLQFFLPLSNININTYYSQNNYDLFLPIYPARLLEIDYEGKEKIEIRIDELGIEELMLHSVEKRSLLDILEFSFDKK